MASLYSMSIRIIQRIWKQSGYGEHGDVSHQRTKNCGRKRVEFDLALFEDIPLHKRTSLTTLACAINMSKTILFRISRAGDEEDPLRTCSSKHFIGKVMFLVAIARPRFDAQGDNARPHIDKNDVAFHQAALKEGLDIRLTNQPPNSPDLNVLDLGFFSAIQSLHYQKAPRNVDELVAAVQKSLDGFPAGNSNCIFLTLQQCIMIETMKAGGSNRYKIPHISKAMLERDDKLPTQMNCDAALVQEVVDLFS
ncbi:hypothetical protein COLO4_30277 [Corchorus olitorius]|uniref:Uncharacterized protein n=1 Tax=Corchorus olitorius TaxID=93759 RepID=A0A1R3H9C4_9ROSI|nr:hypothetical protein COLO4_30277 [Corchorus olitorius]